MATDPPERRPREASPGRRWLLRLAVLAGLLAVGFLILRLMPKKTVPVLAERPVRGPVRDVVSSSTAGEVTPEARAMLRAELGARVTAVLHKSGARVGQGEVLIRLDDADLSARLRQAQAAVSAAGSQVAQAEARIGTLTRQADRARTLLVKGAGTAQLSEDAESAVREAKQAAATARGGQQQASAALEVAKVARSHAQVVAPFSGLLTEVVPGVGETLAPGAPVVQIIDDSRLHVDATIDEADAARVKVGQEAELRLDALPDRVIKGRVSKVDPAVKRDLKGARTLGVEVEVLEVKGALAMGLKPGMSANVDIVVAQKDAVLSLPTSVIVGRGVNRSVFLLVPEGRHHRASKVLGRSASPVERTEIVSGASEGDLVAASLNQKGLEDGALVQVGADEKGPKDSKGAR